MLCSFLAAAPAGQASIPRNLHDPIVEAIHNLQPALSNGRAGRLAKSFASASRRCDIPWQILVSIAFHESSLGIHVTNAKTDDYGMMQVNKKTALRYALSQDRLLRDETYSLAAACRVLSENKVRYSKHLPYWLGLYRSGTRLSDPRIRENAKRYDRMIRLTAASLGYR